MEATLLIVDDEKNTRDGLRRFFEDDYDVYVAAGIEEALTVLRNDRVDVMVTDLRLAGESGMDLIDAALKQPQPPVCIMMTAYGSVDTAVEAMKRGAYDFVTKPLNMDELEILIHRALRGRKVEEENRVLRQQVDRRYGLENIVGSSVVLERVLDTVRQVAATRATVLIEGESGTGKELVAHAIHHLSGRPKDRLVIVHCAALSPQLLESELFGHEKGAFTGAAERRIGRFEAADGGTLFLDEIGEIEPATQVKLLRALGERKIERVGGNRSIEIDVRLVAATNRNLAQRVKEGAFREDLFYRLRVITITMPPLRDRKEDIAALTSGFLREFAAQHGRPPRELTPEALQCLEAYDWPGNVRELRAAIEHAVVLGSGPRLTPRHLPPEVRDAGRAGEPGGPVKIALDARSDFNLHKVERRLISGALEATQGNRTEAAKLLGISRRTLHRKLKSLDLAEEGC
ncbi:MAG TPA: sigma-54 dependent transcriptional regulator [Verrucomicrobiales bacterium]|nr:sigma-54 dependent transcriptional regulator [Verrucomicrobiales bacterium]